MEELTIYPAHHMEKDILVFFPVYNEEDNLSQVVLDWSRLAKEHKGSLLAIDDGSRDNSLALLKRLQHQIPNLIVISKLNSGHGQSCMLGYRWARQQNFEWVFQTDSDGQTKVEDFEPFWSARHQHPFIMGHRPIRGDGFGRRMISLVLATSIWCLSRVWVKDSNVPFRLFHTQSLAPYLEIVPKDLFLANSFLSILLCKKETVHWLPVQFHPRTGGAPSVPWFRFGKIGLKVLKEFYYYRSRLD